MIKIMPLKILFCLEDLKKIYSQDEIRLDKTMEKS